MIPKDILDLVTLIAGICTVIAAIATVVALFYAWKSWKTWKIQQTYLSHRDKLIENEINVISLFHCQGNIIKQIVEMKRIELVRNLTDKEAENYRHILGEIANRQLRFEDEYGFCHFTLERYNIHCPKNLTIDILDFKNQTNKWVDKISICEDHNALRKLTEEYYYGSAAKRDEILEGLKKFRETTLK